MEKTYMKTLPQSPNLDIKINNKIDYLQSVLNAVKTKNYIKVYEMIDSSRFNRLVRNRQFADSNASLSNMTQNIQGELAQFLAPKLFDFLKSNFPFFNYKEVKLGVYEIVFGQWPDARVIGILDTIRVEFIFDEVALGKLEDVFEDGDYQVNEVQIKELEEANKALSEKDTQLAKSDIQFNENQILHLKKEIAVLQLEKKTVQQEYADFDSFIEAARGLYGNYIQSLQKELDVAQ